MITHTFIYICIHNLYICIFVYLHIFIQLFYVYIYSRIYSICEHMYIFKNFVARPSTEACIEGLCNSLQSLSIGAPVKRPSLKRRVLDMVSDSSDDEDDAPVCSKTSWNTESEDDSLSATSILPIDVPEISSSSRKKSKKQKKAKKH